MANLVNLGLYIAAAVLGIIGALLGFVRGLSRQTIRFITIIASVAVSFIISLAIYPAVQAYFAGMTMDAFIQMLSSVGIVLSEPYQNVLKCFDLTIIPNIMSMPVALFIVPFIFVIIFIIVSLLMLILHKVLCGAFAFTKKRNNILTRLLGLALGFVQGVVVMAILLMPICGTINTATVAINKINETQPDASNTKAITSYYDTFLSGTEENLIVKLTNALTTGFYSKCVTVDLNGEKTDMRQTVTAAVDSLVWLGELSNANFNRLTEPEKVAFSAIVDDICNDPYLATVVSDVLRGVSKSVDSGAIVVTFEDPVGGFYEQFIAVLRTSDKDNLGLDVGTIKSIYYIMGDTDTIETLKLAPAKVYTKFSEVGPDGTTLFSKFSRELDKNPRMAGLSTELTQLSMTLLLAGRGQDIEKTDEAMNDVAETLEAIVSIDKESYATEEEYKGAVNETLDTTLNDHGIELPKEKLDELSDIVIEELGDKTEITEKDVSDFMVKYYDIYAKAQKEGLIPPDDIIVPENTAPPAEPSV